jgi:hypothetical protein
LNIVHGTRFRCINSQWHFGWETYQLSQRNVLNITDPAGIIAQGGYPFTPANGFRYNAPGFAVCSNPRRSPAPRRASAR